MRLPASLRPKVDLLTPEAILASIEKLRTSLESGARLFEVSFNEDRASLSMMVSPKQPGVTFAVFLREKREESSLRSTSMINQRSTFTFEDLARQEKAAIDSILARVKAAVPLPGAKAHRSRIWSGEPFWRPRQGMPYLEIRVGVPPRHDVGGYVVFSADGKLVDAAP